MIVLRDLWLSDFAISGSSAVPWALNFAQSEKSVQSSCTSAAAVGVILGSLAALGDPCFSSFILSRTGTWSVRDKIKLDKHGPPIAAMLAKMNEIAAAEMHKASTDFAKI